MRGIANVKGKIHEESEQVLYSQLLIPPQQHMKQTPISATAERNVASNTSLLLHDPLGSEKSFDKINYKTETILKYIIQRLLNLQEFLSSLRKRYSNKSLDTIALRWSTGVTVGNLTKDESKLNVI